MADGTAGGGLLGHRLQQGIERVEASVLSEGAGDDFQRICEGFDRQLFTPGESFCEATKVSCKSDLCRSATGQQEGFFKKLARHAEGVGKASLHLPNGFVGGTFRNERGSTFLGFPQSSA